MERLTGWNELLPLSVKLWLARGVLIVLGGLAIGIGVGLGYGIGWMVGYLQ